MQNYECLRCHTFFASYVGDYNPTAIVRPSRRRPRQLFGCQRHAGFVAPQKKISSEERRRRRQEKARQRRRENRRQRTAKPADITGRTLHRTNENEYDIEEINMELGEK
jgi:hypothetical protein